MVLEVKRDLIIKLYLESMNQADITHEAKTSFSTVGKVIKDYEDSKTKSKETQAFEKFREGHLPLQVKIETDISGENIAKYHLAYKKLVGEGDLFDIYKELGESLPDFVRFYKAASSYNITLGNMDYALDLALRTSNLYQENTIAQITLQETHKAIDAAHRNLLEIQRQTGGTAEINFAENLKASKLRSEIESLNSILEKMKNLKEYQKLEQIIRKSVNSITAEQYLTLEVAAIAIIKKIQREPNLIPLLLTSVPDIKYGTVDPALRLSILGVLASQAMKFMPEVLDELTYLTGIKSLPDLQSLHDWVDQTTEPDEQDYHEVTSFQSDSANTNNGRPEIISDVQNEKNQAQLTHSDTAIYSYYGSWDTWNDAWYYMY